jgi:hypothetical protein
MKSSLSTLRENTPFATPPRVLVVAEEGRAGEALALADALEQLGAETEIRFGDAASLTHNHSDAMVVAGVRGYRIARHHPVLENVLPNLMK